MIGDAGVYATVALMGNLDSLTAKLGLNLCAEVAGITECGSKIYSGLPVNVLTGTWDFGDICQGPGPGPGPGPSGDCCSCVEGNGGTACASKCSARGSACTNCINGYGGKSCATTACGCGGPGPGPDPCPHPAPSPSGNQQWYGPSTCSKQTILFKGNVNKCVDLPNSSQKDGTQIQIWDCNSGVIELVNNTGELINANDW